jgi:nitric oxide reductase NorE protein
MTTSEVARRTPPGSLRRRVPGEPGVWVLIIGDLTVFGVIFLAFMHARGVEPDAFDASQLVLHRVFGVVNTLVLLTSSLFVALAVDAIRRAAATSARRLLFAALLCAVFFLGIKAIEWTALIAGGHGATTNAYFMYFFILTGLHAVHVVLGSTLLMAAVRMTRRSVPSDGRLATIEAFGCCWHLVDVLWLIIFPLLYLVH